MHRTVRFKVAVCGVLLSILAASLYIGLKDSSPQQPPLNSANEKPKGSLLAFGKANQSNVTEEHHNATIEPTKPMTARELWRTSTDLFNVFTKGKGSKDLRQQYFAVQAANTCLPTLLAWQHPQGLSLDARQQQQANAARTALKERCKGFTGQSVSALMADIASIDVNISRAPPPINREALELPTQPTDEQTLAVRKELHESLKALGPEALLWAGPGLATWLEHHSTHKMSEGLVAPILKDTSHIYRAVNLALCELDYPCGNDSLLYIQHCANLGECNGSVRENLKSSISDDKKELIQQQAEFIAEAIKSGELSKLGLGDSGSRGDSGRFRVTH